MRRSILGVRLVDGALAVGLLALKLLILATGIQAGAGMVSYLIAPAWTLPLAWRTRHPRTVALLVVGAGALEAGVGGYHESVVALAALLLVHYSLGAHAASLRRLVVGLAPVLSLDVWVGLGPERLDLQGLAGIGALVAAAVLGGLWVRQLRLRAKTLEQLAAQLEREREERARTAVAEERTRIARELHDEVAHAMSVIAVQADAAEGALPHDPALVQRPLSAIRETARGALADMRRVLGVLRDDEQAKLSPDPGLARSNALLAAARAAGLDIYLHVEGEPLPLPPALDLAAYRVLQEGLTNVRKHAGASKVEVVIRYGLDAIGVEVTDDGGGLSAGNGSVSEGGLAEMGGLGAGNGSGAGEGSAAGNGWDKEEGSGRGLAGIRERVTLLGGELVAGPRPSGFALRVTLPLA